MLNEEVKDYINMSNIVWRKLPEALDYFDGKRFYFEKISIDVVEDENTGGKEIIRFYHRYEFVVEEQTLDAFLSSKFQDGEWSEKEWYGSKFWENLPEDLVKIAKGK